MTLHTRAVRFVDLGKKIVCVGRNYRDHAAELGNPVPTKPILFLKPTTAYLTEGHNIMIPKLCTSLHHEVELGVVIDKRGSDIPEIDAMDYVAGYALALDMTARDLQEEAKKKGQPWLLAKGFDTSCPVSDFISKDQIPNPGLVDLWLTVNGERRQSGNTKDMIFSVPYLISYISSFLTLEPGDLILTGTPAGVSAVKEGDEIQAGIGDIVKISFKIQKKL